MHDLFPVRAILRSIFISGELRVLLFDWKISWRVRQCMTSARYAGMQLKTLSSLLKVGIMYVAINVQESRSY